MNTTISFRQRVREFEHELIAEALREHKGLVSRASRALGFAHHQSLITMIETKHPELMSERTPKLRRHKPLIHAAFTNRVARAPQPLKPVVLVFSKRSRIPDQLELEIHHVFTAHNRAVALTMLRGKHARCDVLIAGDSDRCTAIETAQQVRAIRGRRAQTKLIVLVKRDAGAAEAWRAGADAVVTLTEFDHMIVPTIKRVLQKEDAE